MEKKLTDAQIFTKLMNQLGMNVSQISTALGWDRPDRAYRVLNGTTKITGRTRTELMNKFNVTANFIDYGVEPVFGNTPSAGVKEDVLADILKCEKIKYVTTDGMIPKYEKGDILALSKIANLNYILPGAAYLIELTAQANGLTLLRYARVKEDGILIQDNGGELTIQREDIVQMWIVTGKVNINV